MAAELTETTRLYARCVAAIEPEWIERLGEHLAKRSYREPHWSKDSGSVVAFEQVTVYGLVVVPKRRVQYGPIDPKAARELIYPWCTGSGPVRRPSGFPRTQSPSDRGCAATGTQVASHDVLVDDEAIFLFYAQRIPKAFIAQWISRSGAGRPRARMRSCCSSAVNT
jgi:ATP-dependent helicase HrpA